MKPPRISPIIRPVIYLDSCPKCGYVVTKRRYVPTRVEYQDNAAYDKLIQNIRSEHLMMVCDCGYEWRKEVVPQKEEPK